MSIQVGTASVSAVSGANSFSVTFPKAFAEVPIIVATPRHGTTNSTTIKINSKTTTGFTGNITINNNSNVTYVVEWIAIGLM